MNASSSASSRSKKDGLVFPPFFNLMEERDCLRLPLSHQTCMGWLLKLPTPPSLAFTMWALVDGWREMVPPTAKQLQALDKALKEPLVHPEKEPVLAPFPGVKKRLLEADLLNLFNHADYLACRAAAMIGADMLLTEGSAQPCRILLNHLHGLLSQALTSNFPALYGGNAYDLSGLLADTATLLEEGHEWLDAHHLAVADWPRPAYKNAIAKHGVPRSDENATGLMEDLLSALKGRNSFRPVSASLAWVQMYALMRQALQPGWRWLTAIDGRECAFPLFETTGLMDESEEDQTKTPAQPWDREMAHRLCHLCTRLYRHVRHLPMPLPRSIQTLRQPELTLDEALDTLWFLHDAAFLALVALEKACIGADLTKGKQKQLEKMNEKMAEHLGTLQDVMMVLPHMTPQETRLAFAYSADMCARAAKDISPWLTLLPEALQPYLPQMEGVSLTDLVRPSLCHYLSS